MNTFVLNDEKVINSYGFKILNEGIDLARFKKNPIMLDGHWNSNTSVIGRWSNVRIDGSKLLADAEFDTEDEQAKKLEGKVSRGFIKSCSMGVTYDREYMKANPDGTYTLTQCELFEASLVAVPSNANALKLYAKNGALMEEKEIRLSLKNLESEIKNEKMEKFQLSAPALTALGLANADDANAVSTAISGLKTELDNAKKELSAFKAEKEKQDEANAQALVKGAIAAGKLSATVEADFLKMAKENFALAKTVIDAMPGKGSLAGKVNNSDTAVKTIEDFGKLTHEQQLAFKNDHPEEYRKMFS